MHRMHSLVFLALPTMTLANYQFRLADSIVGDSFFSKFTWWTFNDPTHGQVNYVDMSTAMERNYSFGTLRRSSSSSENALRTFLATGGKFFMSANSQDVVSPGSRGLDSVRIT